ncbi:MAG TPA: MaoC family dehydratase [Pirellulales bacterium]|jgi:acyl dehydratase|nr:MaoC family dehydratase [Pirellulales bacterium]
MALRTIESIEEARSLVGQEVGVSDWIEVSQERINAFAEVTGDHQWIHVDPERARRESPFGTTIAHGFLTLSLITQMQSQAVRIAANQKMGINYGLNRVRFVSPVRAGARVRSRSKLDSLEDFQGGVQLTWHLTVEIENSEKPALVAEWIGRLYF